MAEERVKAERENDEGVVEMRKALAAQAAFEDAMDKGSFKIKDFALLKGFLKYLKPYVANFCGGLAFDVLITLSFVLMPRVNGELVNYFNGESSLFPLAGGVLDFGVVSLFALAYAVLSGIAIFSMYFNGLIFYTIGQRVVFDIRQDLFEHVESLSLAQINALPVGKFVTRITNDCRGLSMFFTDLIVNFVRDVLNIAMTVVISFLLSWQLSLIFLGFMPLIFLISFLFRKYSKKYFRRQWRLRSDINGFLSENFSGIRTIKIFDKEGEMARRFDVKNEELRGIYKKQMRLMAFYRPSIYVMQMAAVVLVLYFGVVLMSAGAAISTGERSFLSGDIVTFYAYTNQFFGPVQDMAELLNSVQSVLTSAERVSALMSVKPSVSDSIGAKPVATLFPNNPVGTYLHYERDSVVKEEEKALLEQRPMRKVKTDFVKVSERTFGRLKGDIEFQGVWFAYVGEEWVLKDVSFQVKRGQTAAFVGATGAGKSTIIGLIVRNMIPQRGRILIDGVDVNEYRIEDLRRNISQMLQEVFLFSGTVADNIDLFDEKPDRKRVEQAVEMVGADGFVNSLEGGLDAVVRERGNNFSVGQRQLLSFARAIYANPSFMVLDEATANIDTETENVIQSSLKKMRELGTMVIVAHRLSTIQDADAIFVVDKGRIVEEGTHDSLLAQKGIYRSMYELQNLEKSL